MATWGGARQLVASSRRWDFPDIDDQSPPPPEETGAARAPQTFRFIVSGIVGLVVLGVAISAVGVLFQRPEPTTPIAVTEDVSGEPPPPARQVIVHVTGAVVAPGLVELGADARVIDAVDAAGGVAEDADINRLNLARPVMDGEHIVVPSATDPATGGGAPGATEPISLSRSSAERLQELPGVGPAIAGRIIDWREKHGGFQTVEDALAIPGIGPATLEKIRAQVVP